MIVDTESVAGRIWRVSSRAPGLGGQEADHGRPQPRSGGQEETLLLSSTYLSQSLLLLLDPGCHDRSSPFEEFVFLVLSLVELLEVAGDDGYWERHDEDAGDGAHAANDLKDWR